MDQGRLPVVGPGLEQAKHAEEGADPVGDLEEVLGLERDHVIPLLYERGLVGPVGVEAGIGRAGEEDRHLRLGQLRGCAHEALPLLEEGRVSGRPHPQERVHRHEEAHIQRLSSRTWSRSWPSPRTQAWSTARGGTSKRGRTGSCSCPSRCCTRSPGPRSKSRTRSSTRSWSPLGGDQKIDFRWRYGKAFTDYITNPSVIIFNQSMERNCLLSQ